ncbi:MAG: peptidoglycan bridge formation glycyltransferase FemA/FemB family protein [Opitutae bacterium]|nr:peptidoglycan bridge formation glycyltransferase FemA/FemB family protein [Opitutae bacterium]
MQIERIDGCGDDELKDYVLSNPRSLLYSSPDYLRLISEHLNAESGWLVARNAREIQGVLPVAKCNGSLGPVFNSFAYYGSNGAVVQRDADEDAKTALIHAFYADAKDAGACSATIINNPLEQDGEFYAANANHDYLDERIGQITHFPDSKEGDDLFAMFSNPRPRNIRKAIKDGVEVSASNDQSSLEFLYNVHFENMQRIGGLGKSWDFFEKVKSLMPEDTWSIHLATMEGQPIAALLLFYFNKTVEYFTPVILAEHRGTQALALVIFEAMKDAMLRGYDNWNWGGTWLSQGGVYDFKKRWGTSEHTYYYFTQVFNQDVLSLSKAVLVKDYLGFYVVPFDALKGE